MDRVKSHSISRGVPSTTRPPLRTRPDSRERGLMQRVLPKRSRLILAGEFCALLQSVAANVSGTLAQTWHKRFLEGSR